MDGSSVWVDLRALDLGPAGGDCCVAPGEDIKGTLFFGGAGMDGAYIPLMISALHAAGITTAMYVDPDKWSGGTSMDAAVGVLGARNFDPRFPMLLRNIPNKGAQFNLIGYSYGSLIAAQIAEKYSSGGTKVDHLVLIGSPISQDFLLKLESNPRINRIIVVGLNDKGDPIVAGMPTWRLLVSLPTLARQMPGGKGHFFYAPADNEGQARRKALAKELFKQGVR